LVKFYRNGGPHFSGTLGCPWPNSHFSRMLVVMEVRRSAYAWLQR